MRVSVWGPAPGLRPRADAAAEPERASAQIVFGGEMLQASVLRGELAPGTEVHGPALCALPEATLLVPARLERNRRRARTCARGRTVSGTAGDREGGLDA